ncbi:hypothetical protein GE061_004711 [Apolygus lucorum]|uniref:ubiquitinyl hydrolase 1 n=1 Tax=Apolygus lucorum TaxID=248454 RepID=A0A8S9X047_APOLU|nr:hypothetical protein GE061_004711 [Apolygus lucorum]
MKLWLNFDQVCAMDANIQAQLQFLNLDDVDANEAEYLQNVLYSGKSPTLELPWVETEELAQAEWPQHPQYDGQPNEIVDTGGGGEMYQMPVPVATTMQQMYHSPVVQQLPSVTYVSGMPHPNYHHGLTQPPPVPPFQGGPHQQMFPAQMPTGPGRQRGSKQSPKRGGGRDGAPAGAYANVPSQGYPTHHTYPPPMHHHVPFPCIPNTPTPHFPTAQHAAGPPLYIANPISMYHPQHLYHNYGAVFSPIAQQQPPEEMKQMEYSVEKVDSVPPAQLPAPLPQQPPHNVYMTAQVVAAPLMEEPPAPANPQLPVAPKDEHHQHHYHQPQQQQPQLQQLHHSEAPPPEEIESQKASGVANNQVVIPPQPVVTSASAATGSVSPAQTTPAPPVSHQEKHPSLPVKSHPPKDAIITTAPPSLPPVKRKVQGTQDELPQPAPVRLPSPASNVPSDPPQQPAASSGPAPTPGGKSWAGLFKNVTPGGTLSPDPSERRAFKPPLNAVAVSAPPSATASKPHATSHMDVSHHKQDSDDPALRNLGDKLTNYKLEHKAIILTPRGLTNPSNYCYINATLQALLACPAFYNLIKLIADVKSASSASSQKDSKTPIIDSMVKFIKEFSQAPPSRFKRMEKLQARKDSTDASSLDMMTDPPFEPTVIYKILRKMRSEDSFHEEGRQEDAEEFLSLLLNGLNDEMLELQKLVADSNPAPIVNGEVTANGDSHEDEALWEEVTTQGNRRTRRAVLERTPLSDIFRGQLRSRLDIESSENVGIALDNLCEGVTIDGDSNSGIIRQQQTLDDLPCVLILHLKCFHYRQQTVSKVIKALRFPVDLRLDPRLLSLKNKNVRGRNYKLFAVVYHDGKEATKGHYLADVFHLGHSGWIRYDDASVKLVKEEEVLDPKPPRVPYLLYYRRADTIGSQRNT